jgi:hypothetical protein
MNLILICKAVNFLTSCATASRILKQGLFQRFKHGHGNVFSVLGKLSDSSPKHKPHPRDFSSHHYFQHNQAALEGEDKKQGKSIVSMDLEELQQLWVCALSLCNCLAI